MPRRRWFLGRTYDQVLGGLAMGDTPAIEACIRMANEEQQKVPRRSRAKSPWAVRNLIGHLPQERRELVMGIAIELLTQSVLEAIDPDAGMPPPDLEMHPEDVEALNALAP